MLNRTSYLALFGALALAGCPDPDPCTNGTIICVDAPVADGGDAGTPPGDVPRADVPMGDTPVSCGTVGQVGGSCRQPGNTCASGLACQQEFMNTMGTTTLSGIFDIPQGAPIAGSDYFSIVDPADPADDVPFHGFTNTLCTSICDVSLEFDETAMTGELDTCGPCAACTTQIGQLGIVPSWVFLPVAMRTFADNTGFCRANCMFDPATTGGCPAGYTCDPGSLVCVEACESDNECQFNFETTRSGELVTVLDAGGGTCSPTTGRCVRGTGTDGVGRPCTGSEECSVDVGVCLRGGTCGEQNCGFAADTMMGGICDGGRGVCLGSGVDNATICVDGCATSADCNPENACIPFRNAMGMPVSVGGFAGYCLGLCDTVASDPDGAGPMTAANDLIINCRAEERCDMPEATTEDADPDGLCRPTCTVATEATDCMGTDERCEMVPSTTYGFCRTPDQLCGTAGLDEDCYLGQRCDLLAQPGNNGLCVDGCTDDTDCTTAGDTCDLTRGVCRTPCPGGTGCAAMGETCLAGLCEQLTTT